MIPLLFSLLFLQQLEEENPLFQLTFTHEKRIAQSTAMIDAYDNNRLDLVVACKRKIHLIRNLGQSLYEHAQTFKTDNANGWGTHDFNGDGRMDLFVAQQQKRINDCWLNLGDGTFSQQDLGNETRGNTRNVLFADFDGDGYVDSFHSVSSFGTNHNGCELHPGVEGGSFGPDMIEGALPDHPGFWCAKAIHPERGEENWSNKMFKGAFVRDLDGDQKPDIVLGAYADRGFQEGGRGGFGMQWVDQQDRGLFILHNCSTPGKIRFKEVAKAAMGDHAWGATSKDWNVYSVIPIDYDRDGDFDLFAGAVVRSAGQGQKEDTRAVGFFENISQQGKILFEDKTKEAGFSVFNDLPPSKRAQRSFASGAPLDYNNDGWTDLCLVNRRDAYKTPYPYPHLFCNTGEKSFSLIPHQTHGLGHGGGGRDLCYGDLNGDGLLDLIINDGTVGGYDGADNSRIYENRIQNQNHWIQVKADQSGTPAIGAKVWVYGAGTHKLLGFDEMRTDFCYRSKRAPVLHFGLGRVQQVDLKILTKDGKEITANGLGADQLHRIQVQTKEEIKTYQDIEYAKLPGVDPNLLSLDIYSASQKHNNPVMVMIHGGGWRKGDKANRSMTRTKPAHFVNAGYVYVSINYRLSDRPEIKHPVHIQDVARAMAWIHNHISEYGGDPDRIYVMGHSAGAHLASLIAVDETRLKAEGKDLSIIKGVVCLDSAAYDIPRIMENAKRVAGNLYKNAFGHTPESWRDASSRHHVAAGKNIPPMLFFHTGARMQGEVLSREMVQALNNAQVPAQTIHAADKDHSGINACIGQTGDPYTKLIMAFLKAPHNAGKLAKTEKPKPFGPLDRDGDGMLSHGEFKRWRRAPMTFEEIDEDQDGRITLEEANRIPRLRAIISRYLKKE